MITKQRFPRRRGFSLMEMVVVMAVIVILISLVVPAVNNFGRASALTGGGNVVTNLVVLARQTAISKNTLTALVLLTDQGTAEDYRAFTVLEYQPTRGWSQVSKWDILPEGVVVDRSNPMECTFLNNSPHRFPFLAGPPQQENPPVSFKGEPVSEQGYAARIFLPTGGLQNPEWPAQLRLVEGHLNGGQVVYTRRGEPRETANFYDIAIIGATGVAKVSRP